MKKLLSISLLLLSTMLLKAQTQNNIWSLPPNYVKFTGGPPSLPIALPIPALQPDGITPNQLNDPYDGYDGQISNFNHNAMQDANGDLYFFTVDGFVYDFNGHFIGFIQSFSLGYNVKGYAETIIVPVPGSCTQYYIIGEIYTGIGHNLNMAEYAILDMSVTSYETGSQGALIGKSQQSDPPPYNQSAFWGNGFELTNAVPMAPNFSLGSDPEVKISMAASDLRSDNTRFLYIMGERDIARYKVTASGITYDNYEFVLAPPNVSISAERAVRSEMELIKTPTGYRIACSYPSTPASNDIVLFVGEINNNGDITSYNVIGLPSDNLNNISPIKGIEFSPNGNYIYITHVPNNVNPLPFKIYDVINQSFIPLANATMQNEIPAFKNSQIELGKDGKLYLANATSLATIGNADNPSALIWNSSALTISYNLNQLGFSTNTESMKLYPLPDQIDGMDYTAYFTEGSLECCVRFSPFTTGIDMNNNEHTISGTWDDNINPYGAGVDIITVRDELIIKSGANITANNLTFKFAPDAKLVVEQGAIFTVNNCTLTVETTCENAPMWNGVDVMGPTNGQQTTAGKFIANNSLIEHSYWAVHNFKTLTGGVLQEEYGPGYRGGVIIATNTTFRNNHRGAVFFDFQNSNGITGIDDQSKFNNCTFVTDGLLNKPALTPSVIMAHLFGVQGVNFLGCDFKTTDPSIAPTERGSGIEAVNCLLTVSSLATGGISVDRSTFTDMTRGIDAYSSLSSPRTTKVRNTDFNNVWRCIYLKSNNLAMVLDNTFDVASDNAWSHGYGLYLDFCNKFKVENNAFNTTHNGFIGTYTWESQQGNNNNEIYKNTFNNFIIGSQAAGINGNSTSTNGGLGLEYRCNTYTNINNADIYVSSGGVKPFHGSCVPAKAASNNKFSYTALYGDFLQAPAPAVVDFVSYQYNIGANLEPRTGYFNPVNTDPTECVTLYDAATQCPIHYTKSFVVLKDEYAIAKQQVATLTAQIDEGNTKGLTAIIQTESPGNVLNALIEASPYLSDEVLLAYLATNPPNGNLQQVLTANSPLSEEVMAALQQLNLPKGIKTIVSNAQIGTSAMQELLIEIAYHKNEVDQIKSDILRYFLFDDAVEERLKEAIEFLNDGDCSQSRRQCELTEFYIANKEYTNATQELSALTGNIEDADFVKLFTNIIELEQTTDPVQELATNPIKQQPIIEVAEATNRKQETARAEVMLKRAKLRNYQETIEELNFSGSGLRLINQEETSNIKLGTSNLITVYPNPTSGEVNITHNLSVENGKVTFKVYNMIGVEVLNENLTSANNEVKINNLKAGVYFYTITQNNSTIKTDKLMVR